MLQRRGLRPPLPGEVSCWRFNGAAELLQRRDRGRRPRREREGGASTEPLNCFSGERVHLDARMLARGASTEPLNCFSGEAGDGAAHVAPAVASTEPLNCFSGEIKMCAIHSMLSLGFNGAAELLQRRDRGDRCIGAASSRFNGAAELLQRRGERPTKNAARFACFNGAAELLQRRGRKHVRGCLQTTASTEPLNCFSGEGKPCGPCGPGTPRFNGAAELLQRRVPVRSDDGRDVWSFNGAAELLQRRGARRRHLVRLQVGASTEPLNRFSG